MFYKCVRTQRWYNVEPYQMHLFPLLAYLLNLPCALFCFFVREQRHGIFWPMTRPISLMYGHPETVCIQQKK